MIATGLGAAPGPDQGHAPRSLGAGGMPPIIGKERIPICLAMALCLPIWALTGAGQTSTLCNPVIVGLRNGVHAEATRLA